MITPAEFLELLNDKEKSDFKIGTIDPNYSGGKAKIKFDGEDTVSGKEYLSVGYSPKANDRVLLVKISGTYLILGEIGSAGGGGGGETITASDVSLLSNNFIANNVEGGMDELFTNVSNGKDLIATAITDKGVATSGSDTFQVMANKISNISDGLDISFGGTDIPLLKLEDLKILSIPRNATSTMREVIVKFDGTMAITFTLFVAGTGSPIPLHAEFLVNNILQGDKITVASFTPVETIVEIAVRENDNIKFNVSHDRTSSISARSNLFQLNVYPIFNINPVTHII